jgi:biopolymer transport protein ExbD
MKKQFKKTRLHSEQDVLMDMNMTPLIDVMLVLIIMLIISIPIQQHAIEMNNPSSSVLLKAPPKKTKIDILEDGQLLWNDQALTIAELENNFKQITLQQVQDDIQIHAAPQTAYNNLIKVMALAQRQGVTKIGIYE